MSKACFRLRELVFPLLSMWLVAWVLGLITLVSVLGLLMVSGWFITMAGAVSMTAVGSHAFNYLAPSALIRTFAVTRTLGRYGDLVFSHQVIFELLKRLRVRFFNEFANLDAYTRSQIGSNDVQYRLVKDIDTLDEFVLKVVSPWVMGVFMTVGLSWLLGAMLAWWLGVFLAIVLVLAVVCSYRSLGLADSEHQLQSARKMGLLAVLPALTQLLIWGRWQQVSRPIINADDKLLSVYKKSHQTKQLFVLFVQYLMAALALMVLYVGIGQIQNKTDTALLLALLLGVFGAAEFMLPLVSDPLAFGRSQLAKNRLNALLATPSPTQIYPLSFVHSLSVTDLSARQKGAVFGLSGLSFVVNKGKPLIVKGVSGGGKSTLLDVLAGELMPIQGDVRLMDKSGQSAPLVQAIGGSNALKIGYLAQRVDIFDQSLENNLRLGKACATEDELWAVLGLVGLDGWAKQQPKGLKTPLGEYGAMVSGGQARRIALARLLLSPKDILLLDEPFAGLDETLRQHLWQTLKHLQKQGLLIVVSHHDINDDVDVLTINEPAWLDTF